MGICAAYRGGITLARYVQLLICKDKGEVTAYAIDTKVTEFTKNS